MKIFRIEFDYEWILKHRHDEVPPTTLLERRIIGYDRLDLHPEYVSEVSLYVLGDIDLEGMTRLTHSILSGEYHEEVPVNVYEAEEEYAEEQRAEEEEKNKRKAKDADSDKDEDDGEAMEDLRQALEQLNDLIESDGKEGKDPRPSGASRDKKDSEDDSCEEACQKEPKPEQSEDQTEEDEDFSLSAFLFNKQREEARNRSTDQKINELLTEIDSLISVQPYKKLLRELIAVAPKLAGDKKKDVVLRRSYLFAVSDGSGLSTYLRLLAKVISATGVAEIIPDDVYEIHIPKSDKLDEEFLGNFDRVRPIVACLDISEWINDVNKPLFKELLRKIERYSARSVVVFRVPYLESNILSKISDALNDVLTTVEVPFPPFDGADLRKFALTCLTEYGYTISPSAWKIFDVRIAEEKRDGKFYGLNTVKKVVRELVYQKEVANADKNESDTNVTRSDVKRICKEYDPNAVEMTGEEELAALVGQEAIKEKVKEILSQIDLAERFADGQKPALHMRFLGNPGTGKTTVARILGKILKDRGVLRIGAFYEYSGRDLCGRYIGETAPKTAGICRDAYGSVLFIDEAYSLYRSDDEDSKDYGKEALETLIAEMENHRDDLLVIMAGYTDDMEKLMRGNLGLAGRMPYVLEFANFTRDQLYEIFVGFATKRFPCEEETLV
ncbi:MAG: AAA family ATPase, partial [Clostridia bacterium]|nr:AAA family ATPase [Clostridia bacterium]